MADFQKLRMIKMVSEILENYLMNEEEAYAECTLRFLKQNGEIQGKVVRWIHPDLEVEMPRQKIFSIGDLLKMSPLELSNAETYYWNMANEVIANRNAVRQEG